VSALWDAAGKALLHFLWQGALLGVAAAAVLRAWRERAPESRYGAACVFYLAMAISPVATIAVLLAQPSIAAPHFASAAPPLMDWLPALWASGVALFTLRAAGGYVEVRLRGARGRRPAPGDLARRCARLASALGIERTVRLFVSSRVATPCVFGWLRPVILVPARALTRLPADQLEGILAHEFAHIVRRDFLVNCLQTAVEALLFYHPAVWWLSTRIRRERELCCDAAAVSLCGRLVYSRALLALEESRTAFALAASGGSLKERIMRILHPYRDHRNHWPAAPVALALSLLVGSCWAAAQAPAHPVPPQAPVEAVPPGPPPARPAQAAIPAPAPAPAPRTLRAPTAIPATPAPPAPGYEPPQTAPPPQPLPAPQPAVVPQHPEPAQPPQQPKPAPAPAVRIAQPPPSPAPPPQPLPAPQPAVVPQHPEPAQPPQQPKPAPAPAVRIAQPPPSPAPPPQPLPAPQPAVVPQPPEPAQAPQGPNAAWVRRTA
jgi:beta-lactamase regulating signal transducer with metallopeptidase domain